MNATRQAAAARAVMPSAGGEGVQHTTRGTAGECVLWWVLRDWAGAMGRCDVLATDLRCRGRRVCRWRRPSRSPDATQGKGSVSATKAVGAQGKGSVVPTAPRRSSPSSCRQARSAYGQHAFSIKWRHPCAKRPVETHTVRPQNSSLCQLLPEEVRGGRQLPERVVRAGSEEQVGAGVGGDRRGGDGDAAAGPLVAPLAEKTRRTQDRTLMTIESP